MPSKKRYYVVVYRVNNPSKIITELSGRLWATDQDSADIEAGRYQTKLNHNQDLVTLKGNYYIAEVRVVLGVRYIPGFKSQRVTPSIQQTQKSPQ
jgi:hypothetical protein